MDKRPSDILWVLLKTCGIDKNKQNKSRLILFFTITLYFLFQSLACLIIRWTDANARYLAIEDFEHTLFDIWIIIDMLLTPNNILTVMDVIDNKYFSYDGFNFSEKKKIIIEQNEKQLTTVIDGIFYMILFHVCTNCIPPLIISIHMLINTEHENITLPLPYEGLFPFNINEPIIYLLVYLTNVFYGYIVYFYCATIMLASTSAVMHRIVTDIRLLNISIQEINEYFNSINAKEETNLNNANEIQLRHLQGQLIENHKLVIRNLKRANLAVSMSSLDTNQAASLFGCISLYKFLEVNEIAETIKYAFVFALVVSIFFMYCVNGQRIQNEDQKLRNALAEFNWINKPRWFKKCHLLMMTRSNNTLELKPFGLYTLNYDNFTTVMKAAYTFCNLLRTIRQK